MDISLALLELALVFLPGIIWAAIDNRYGPPRPFSEFRFTLSAFLFGTASYAELALAYWIFDKELVIPALTQDLNQDFRPLIGQIFLALFLAFASAIVWAAASNRKLFSRLLRAAGVTKRFGDEDVWEFVFNSGSPMSEYVNLRDFGRQLTYAGYVGAFSDSGEIREILLRDVDVYDFAGTLLYNMPHIYLARSKSDLHIELPYRAMPPI